jgi:D-alanine-D-alanine ligase
MNRKIRVAVLFGGRSSEHEVSLQSAKNVIDAIDKSKYEVVPVGIDKQGIWYLNDGASYLLNANNPKTIALNKSQETLAVLPGKEGHPLMKIKNSQELGQIDVVFPVLHGTNGEDGAMQGMLKLMDIPFVGASVLGSAIGMDKDVMKRLLRDAGIPIGKFLVFHKHAMADINFDTVVYALGLPFFVKPANTGSSIGVHKVKDRKQFDQAIADAFQYDHKILAEEFIKGREIEISVLGNENPIASFPGEVIPTHEFYSYEAKYLDANGARIEIPALLRDEVVKQVQTIAIKTFKVLCCDGMARVDFFMKESGELFVNEINTIPGFTKISMYPKMWQASGLQYSELIDRLIQLALEKAEKQRRIRTSADL